MDIGEFNIAQPDVTLRLDMHGVIEEASASVALSEAGLNAWVGQPWADIVGNDIGREKIARLLSDARKTGVSGFRQLTQKFPSGQELPMEFTAVSLGEGKGLVAIGKNLQAVAELQSRLLAAQRAMEQDYWKLRHIETRYRMLFDSASDAVVLVSATDLRIIEANPAAIRALGMARAGGRLIEEIDERERDAVKTMLNRVWQQGKAPGMLVHIGRERTPWLIRASLMASEVTTDGSAHFLIQFTPAGTAVSNGADLPSDPPFGALLDRLPEGIVIASQDGVVEYANRGFRRLVQHLGEESLAGHPLARWLAHPPMDIDILLDNLMEHQSVGYFPTRIRDEYGDTRDVEIAAGLDGSGAERRVILSLRDSERRLPGAPDDTVLVTALAGLTNEIGKTSLRDLVKKTAATLEKYYIEAALSLTSGNRTAAAQLLGLSRQSLYLKISRYDLGDKGD